jgi:unsaturated chondroitin disaccharide hydrolase
VFETAIAGLIRRVDETLAEAGGRFPVSADPESGAWTWAEDGEWCGGFWTGLLWLAAAATGEERLVGAAGGATDRLRARMTAPTMLRGFLFWYSAGIGTALGAAGGHGTGGGRWAEREGLADLAVAAAAALSGAFDPAAGVLSPGAEDAERYLWPRPGACIDGLPGGVPLLATAAERVGRPEWRTMALAHARNTFRLCGRTGGSVAQSATYDASGQLTGQDTPNGSSADSTWSRAQAWGMLGLAQAAQLSAEFVPSAITVADWYLEHAPADLICFWEFDPAGPDAPRDTSAAAIAAAALIKLGPLAGERYRAAAEQILGALTADHLGSHGGLIDGCYSHKEHKAERDELVWGDYFALEAMLALDGVIDGGRL